MKRENKLWNKIIKTCWLFNLRPSYIFNKTKNVMGGGGPELLYGS